MTIGTVLATLLAVVPSVQQMKGPFPIMSTPYFADGSVDSEGLVREARFVQKSGCPGCIWGQSNDAVDLLTREEKRQCFEACARAVEGLDITVALGADGTNTAEMLEIAADIEAAAARHPTARIAMISRPPDDVRSEAEIEKAWDALATVAKRPVIFQTYGTKETPTPSVALLVRLAKRHPAIYGYVKEEAEGFGAVERMREENKYRPEMKTLMAGWGAWQLLIQIRHCGCEGLVTERCAYAPILGKLWRTWRDGEDGLKLAEDFAMFRLCCDQKNFPGGLRGYHLYLLEKEGVFKNRLSRQYKKAEVRDAGSFGAGREWELVDVKLTDLQKKELDRVYEDMMNYSRPTPNISVFAKFVRGIARERGVSLAEAAELLYGLGVRGYDCGPDEEDLDELAATKLRPINFYYFPDWFGIDQHDWNPLYADRTPPDECLKKAKRYGIPRIMVVPPWFTDERENEADFAKIVAKMRDFVAAAKAEGITVTIEDFGGTGNCCSYLKYMKRLLTEIPDLKLALDTGNLYYAGRGEDVMELLRFAKGRIAHVHLKDQQKSDNRAYVTLGLGAVPNEAAVKATWRDGYTGWYTLENLVGNLYDDAARQTAVLRSWTSPVPDVPAKNR